MESWESCNKIEAGLKSTTTACRQSGNERDRTSACVRACACAGLSSAVHKNSINTMPALSSSAQLSSERSQLQQHDYHTRTRTTLQCSCRTSCLQVNAQCGCAQVLSSVSFFCKKNI